MALLAAFGAAPRLSADMARFRPTIRQSDSVVVEEHLLVVVNGVPGSGKTTLARALALRTGLPHLSKDALKTFLAGILPAEQQPQELSLVAGRLLWDVVAALRSGAIVETWFGPTGRDAVEWGYSYAGFRPEQVTEIWCDVPLAVARERFRSRLDSPDRPSHLDTVGRDDSYWQELEAAEPLGLSRVLRVRTDHPVDPQTVDDLVGQLLRTAPG